MQHPVIVLIDNDAGAKAIYNTIKEVTKVKPTGTESFVHIVGNLYLIATPLYTGASTSTIEDCFDVSTKAALLGDKLFDPSNDYDTETHYGKGAFAHYVVQPNADEIDFSGFAPLLARLVEVIDGHAKQPPPHSDG